MPHTQDKDRLKFRAYLDKKMSIYFLQKNINKRLDFIIKSIIIKSIVNAK